MSEPREPSPTFEQALDELQQIISAVEAGELGLEESLARYERGRFLIEHCRSVLDKAQQRMDRLTPGETAAGEAFLSANDDSNL